MKKVLFNVALLMLLAALLASCVSPAEPGGALEDESAPSENATMSKEDIWRANSAEIIDEVTKEMEEKGWSDIRLIEGWGNWEHWCLQHDYRSGLSEEEQNMFVYTLWGQWEGLAENYIDIVVRIVFDDESPNGRIYKVFYQSEAGRYLAADDIISGSPIEIDEIIATDDERLLDFMYSC